jgi:N-acetyl-gamma-glutamyl-phosphate reductase
MVSATIVGASGYLGSELLRILANHPEVDRIVPTSRSLAGKSVSTVHRNLLGVCEEKFVDLNIDSIDTDVAFFSAPPGDWFAQLPAVLDKGVKAITLGGKFRIKNAKIDKEVYGGYENCDLLAERVYGMPEIYRKEIKKARLVANPGCYATSIILAIKPLEKLKADIDIGRISVVSISGSSGAGAEPSAKTHHADLAANLRPYNTGFHRHTPEIESILNESFKNLRVSFVPILGDFRRGILTTAQAYAEKDVAEDLPALYRKHYKGEPFVRITPEPPEIAYVADSNFCDIRPEYDKDRRRILVVSAIDNMVKGGSGTAVQNMNLMTGLDEKAGLRSIAGHP